MEAAGVDRRGELIRLRLRPGGSIDAVRSALEELGFASETVALAAAQRWYGPSDVRELSRDEAESCATIGYAETSLPWASASRTLRDGAWPVLADFCRYVMAVSGLAETPMPFRYIIPAA